MAIDLLCFTALGLGLRHGLDFDHMAAIADLVGSNAGDASSTQKPKDKNHSVAKIQSCLIAISYASGHAAVVAILGLCALLFSAILPSWIDPLIEKLVGASLIFLGSWMLYCLFRKTQNNNSLAIPSRGRLLLDLILAGKERLERTLMVHRQISHPHKPTQLCNWQCALAIGALHGIGAETGTQVILLTSVAGSNNLAASLMMLSSFITGMLASSIIIATIASEGYYRAASSRIWLKAIGSLVAVLSILIGTLLISNKAEVIPSLDSLFLSKRPSDTTSVNH
jgi:cytochrome c biogenesis protein CcdA